MAKESTITEYIIAQLEQPVLTTQLDENGKKVNHHQKQSQPAQTSKRFINHGSRVAAKAMVDMQSQM